MNRTVKNKVISILVILLSLLYIPISNAQEIKIYDGPALPSDKSLNLKQLIQGDTSNFYAYKGSDVDSIALLQIIDKKSLKQMAVIEIARGPNVQVENII